MQALLRRLLPRGVGTLVRASVIGQLATLVAMPLLTRWCSLGDFGLLQLYGTVTTVAGLVACLRYDYAILQPADQTTAKRLVLLALLVALGAGLVTLGVVPLLTWSLRSTGWKELVRLTPVVAISVAATGMASAATQWLIRQGQFDALARSRWIQSVLVAVLQLGGAVAGLGGHGLILGDAIGRLVGLAFLLQSAHLFGNLPGEGAGPAALARLGRDYLRFPAVAAPSALINAVGFSLPVFFVERFYGTTGLGVFSLLERVMGVPTLFIGQPLSQTFIHRLRESLPGGPASNQGEIRRTVGISALFGSVPFLALALAGPFLFTLVFGGRWAGAGGLAQMLAVPYFVSFVFWPVMPTLIILNRLRTQMTWETARVLGMLALAAAASSGRVPLDYMVAMIVLLMSSFSLVHFWLCYSAAGRGIPPSLAGSAVIGPAEIVRDS